MMRSKAIEVGEFEEVFKETPMLEVYKCASCGKFFVEEIGTLEEYYGECPHCHESLL